MAVGDGLVAKLEAVLRFDQGLVHRHLLLPEQPQVRARQGHGHDATQFGFKTGDSLYDAIECRSTQELMALSSTGRSYSIAVASLPSTVEVSVTGLRSTKGQLLVCLTTNPKAFPDCSKDPAARTAMVPAGATRGDPSGRRSPGRRRLPSTPPNPPGR